MLQTKILYFVTAYGYIGIFLALVFGIIGLPIPDEVLLAFAGFLISKGKMDFFLVVLVSFTGSIIGVSFSYTIGYKLGMPFIKKYGKYLHIKETSFYKIDRWFEKYGKYTIVLGYFIPGVRQLIAYYAGIMKKSYWRFGMYAYLGGLLWVTSFVALGVLVGERWDIWVHHLHRLSVSIGIVIGIGIIGYMVMKKIKR